MLPRQRPAPKELRFAESPKAVLRPLRAQVRSTHERWRARMASKLKIKVNGLVHNVTASLDTPLLYVLHNELHLHGPRFGCGLAQCGACSVLLDGKEIRSCVTPVAAVSGRAITTLEGMPALWAAARGTTAAAPAGVASAAAGVDRCSGSALRLLPERNDDPGRRSVGDDEAPDRGADPHGDERSSLPLWHVSENPDGDSEGRCCDGEGWEVAMTEMLKKEFSRTSFLKGGGAMVVGFSLAGAGLAGQGGCCGGADGGGVQPVADQARFVAAGQQRQHDQPVGEPG